MTFLLRHIKCFFGVFRRNVKINYLWGGGRGIYKCTNEKGPISLKFYTLLIYNSENRIRKNYIVCSLDAGKKWEFWWFSSQPVPPFLANFRCLFTFLFGLRVSDMGCYMGIRVCKWSNFFSSFRKWQFK